MCTHDMASTLTVGRSHQHLYSEFIWLHTVLIMLFYKLSINYANLHDLCRLSIIQCADLHIPTNTITSVLTVAFSWSPYVIGQTTYIFILSFVLSSFFRRLSSPVRDWMSAILPHITWCGFSANLECRSETCCTGLAGNAGCKKLPKHRHLRTIVQLYRAISSQLRHVSIIGKKTC